MGDVSRKDDEHCRRVLAARAAEWVKGGRGSSHLLEADELHVVRRWLDDERARDPGVSEEIHSLVASSEAVLAAQVAKGDDGRRRLVRWLVVLAVLTGAVAAVSTYQMARELQAARNSALVAVA
jgi:hypothetical protein